MQSMRCYLSQNLFYTLSSHCAATETPQIAMTTHATLSSAIGNPVQADLEKNVVQTQDKEVQTADNLQLTAVFSQEGRAAREKHFCPALPNCQKRQQKTPLVVSEVRSARLKQLARGYKDAPPLNKKVVKSLYDKFGMVESKPPVQKKQKTSKKVPNDAKTKKNPKKKAVKERGTAALVSFLCYPMAYYLAFQLCSVKGLCDYDDYLQFVYVVALAWSLSAPDATWIQKNGSKLKQLSRKIYGGSSPPSPPITQHGSPAGSYASSGCQKSENQGSSFGGTLQSDGLMPRYLDTTMGVLLLSFCHDEHGLYQGASNVVFKDMVQSGTLEALAFSEAFALASDLYISKGNVPIDCLSSINHLKGATS
ncbi:hypothetical protein TRIUR3_31051 [Triticum urartu]|uniref:Uncharacterized protein n=1 Tax=Triticum urartu TaxID=4572 RepID=M7YRM0_TRIUA|nr:hypothetical protein TRIUR3_31051 [Triticum urartu]